VITVFEAELPENVEDVHPNGRFTEVQLAGDGLI
jgi:hypothetical protein